MTTLPPGRDGLPLLGETLDFAKNPFGFIEKRLATNGGRVFRSRVLGRQTAVIAGADAAGRFIDPNAVVREGSMPPHVQELFGGRSLPLLDGEVHAARKREVLKAFGRDALASYLPLIEKTTQDYFARWAKEPEIGWIDELKKLSIEVICAAIIGMPRGNGMDQLRRDYIILLNGFATLPINLPGTRYRKALQARDRILDALRQAVRERRRVSTNDGLSRILASGALSDEEAALELHHIVIAGFIVWAELASMVHQLTLHPDVRERLAREVQAADSYSSMPYLLQVVNEVKRLCSIVPVVFGKTKEPMPIDDVTVPAGWMVLFALVPSHGTHGVYTNPERFDPDRFSPERAEDKRHEHAFVPQGAGPATGHRCPGLDLATLMMSVFAATLLRSYTWELPPQNFETDWSKTPPEMKDGLRARVRALG
ncbi:MAG TPA: cytochrome P450 [Vicinamibacterales bacterium]|jgi:cytochrome P450